MIKRKKLVINLAIASMIFTVLQTNLVWANNSNEKITSIENTIKSQREVRAVEIIGQDRFDTAIKISKTGFKEMISGVILVNADALSDALCVAPLAKAYDCPILLINKDNVPDAVYKEINRLGAQDITLIGSEGVISSKVEKELKDKGYDLNRIGGNDRYETSVNIAKELNEVDPVTEIAIVNGVKGLADATSISAPSARDGRAILYTNGNDIKGLESFINNNIKKAYIVGKEGAVSTNVETDLQSKGLEVKRLGGEDRKDTNAKVITEFYNSKDLEHIYIAKDGSIKESDLVDALAVGPLAAKMGSPIMIASKPEDLTGYHNSLSEGQVDFLKNNIPKEITRVGGGSNQDAFQQAMYSIDALVNWVKYLDSTDGGVIEMIDSIAMGTSNRWISIVKKDNQGSTLWSHKIDEEDSYCYWNDGIVLNDDSVIVSHYSDDKINVVKYDKDGNKLWNTFINSNLGDDYDSEITVDGDNIMVKVFTISNRCAMVTINKDGKVIKQEAVENDFM